MSARHVVAPAPPRLNRCLAVHLLALLPAAGLAPRWRSQGPPPLGLQALDSTGVRQSPPLTVVFVLSPCVRPGFLHMISSFPQASLCHRHSSIPSSARLCLTTSPTAISPHLLFHHIAAHIATTYPPPRSPCCLCGGAATAASGAIHNAGSLNPDAVWPTFVQQRVHDTFFALGAGIAFTAAATATLWQMGAANVLMSRPLVAGIGGFVVTIGAMMFTRSIPADNKVAKYAGLALFNTAIGFSLCPMVALGGPLLLRAAAITGGIVGSLSFIAANSPSDKFLFMAGPLSMGLGAVVVASLGAAFFPAARAAPLLMNVSMYGGLVSCVVVIVLPCVPAVWSENLCP